MENELLELFIILNYDNNKPLAYYLTDNADKCQDIMYQVDIAQETDNTTISNDKFGLCWQSAFENECHRQGVKAQEICSEHIRSYSY